MLRQLFVTRDESEERMSTASSKSWPLLAVFTAAFALPIAYIVAAILGWIDWAAWMPVALSLAFVAWSAAIRINQRH